MAREVSRHTLFQHDEMFDDGNAHLRSDRSRVTGVWARVDLIELEDGSHKATARVREHRVAFRASGEAYGYWSQRFATSITTTQKNLVLQRTTKGRVTTSKHVFDFGSAPDLLEGFKHDILVVVNAGRPWNSYLEHDGQEIEAINAANQTIAERFLFPKHADRYPLLELGDTHAAWLDSTDLSQVAKKLFGVKAYRRPLVSQIERFQLSSQWFALFRGLVPTEWIVEAMEATPTTAVFVHNAADMREIRRILVRTPRPVLRRILRDQQHIVIRSLRDASIHSRFRDLDKLTEVIEEIGQRRVRGVVELERLIMQLPRVTRKLSRSEATAETLQRESAMLSDLQRFARFAEREGLDVPTWEQWSASKELRDSASEQMQESELARRSEIERQQRARREQEHAESASWCREMVDQVSGQTVNGMRVLVADDAQTLMRWGTVMDNCIGSYTSRLGLNLFLALEDRQGRIRANIMVSKQQGVEQALGRYNKPLRDEFKTDAQKIVDELTELGLKFSNTTWGAEGLLIGTPALAAA